MSDQENNMPRRILLAVVLGLVAWGVFHTIGAYQSVGPVEFNVRRSLVVAAFFAAFLAFWGVMLFVRKRRTGGSASRAAEREHGDGPVDE